MAIRSLRQTYERMINEKYQSGAANPDEVAQLENLKNRIDKMYAYRNNTLQDADPNNREDLSRGVVNNICYQHYYKSFDEFQKDMGTSYSLSIGDLNDALDQMAFCTCNARQIQHCDCVARDMGNTCDCNARRVDICDCLWRDGGKYNPSCACNARHLSCECQARSQGISCSCHGRCSCHSVNEYSMIDPKEHRTCDCVSREYGDQCQCHSRESTFAPVEACQCQARTEFSVPTCACRVRHSSWLHGGGLRCECRDRTAQYTPFCECDARTSDTNPTYCQCVSRTSTVMCTYNIERYN